MRGFVKTGYANHEHLYSTRYFMKTIARQEKVQRTIFRKLPNGAVFYSNGDGPFVKVGRNKILPVDALPQSSPEMTTVADINMEVVLGTPTFQQAAILRYYFSNSIPGEGDVVPGDPLLPPIVIGGTDYGSVAYQLNGQIISSAKNRLTWNFPSTFTDGLHNVPGSGPGGGTPNWPCYALLLQRSDTEDNMPHGLGTPITISGGGSNSPPTPIAVYGDAHWATIKEWGPGVVSAMPVTWDDDNFVAGKAYAYRLVMFMGHFGVGPGGWAEVDWNSVVLMPAFKFTDDSGWNLARNRTELAWSAPNFPFS